MGTAAAANSSIFHPAYQRYALVTQMVPPPVAVVTPPPSTTPVVAPVVVPMVVRSAARRKNNVSLWVEWVEPGKYWRQVVQQHDCNDDDDDEDDYDL